MVREAEVEKVSKQASVHPCQTAPHLRSAGLEYYREDSARLRWLCVTILESLDFTPDTDAWEQQPHAPSGTAVHGRILCTLYGSILVYNWIQLQQDNYR